VVVIPSWLDQVSTLDFTPEKALLAQIEIWAQANGWTVSDGSGLPLELRQRTDVLLEQVDKQQRVRLAVLQKSRSDIGLIRLDASNLRTVEIVYRRRTKLWRMEVAGVPVEDDILARGWDWLFERMFKT